MDNALRQLLTLGKEYYLKRDYANARAYLEQVVERSDSFADVYNMLGVIFHDIGQFSKAQSAFEQALSINPGYTEASLNLAVLYNDLGKYGDAREVYRNALKKTKQNRKDIDPFVAGKIANMHADTGDAYLSAGKPTEAILCYHQAVSLCPTFADIRTRLAMALRDQGDLETAVRELEQAVSDRPEYMHAKLQLGVCLHSKGDTERALEVWNEVLRHDAQNRNALMYIKMVEGE